jgi:membrane fusion protein, multidrug efflux system
MGVAAALILAGIWVYGIPWIQLTLNTVSTDDAYVNGHVTFVAARVSGQVARVLVDDNNRVHKGDLLVQLDKEPYQDAVAVKRAAVDTAKADLQAATAAVRGVEAQARGLRWKLQYAMEDVDNRVALLHARVAALDKNKKATLTKT